MITKHLFPTAVAAFILINESKAQFFKDPLGTIARIPQNPSQAIEKLVQTTPIVIVAPTIIPTLIEKKIIIDGEPPYTAVEQTLAPTAAAIRSIFQPVATSEDKRNRKATKIAPEESTCYAVNLRWVLDEDRKDIALSFERVVDGKPSGVAEALDLKMAEVNVQPDAQVRFDGVQKECKLFRITYKAK